MICTPFPFTAFFPKPCFIWILSLYLCDACFDVDLFMIHPLTLKQKKKAMSEEQMNSYRLTSLEEPGDERMAQIMREVAEEARESNQRAAERIAAGIEAATQIARARVEAILNNLRNGNK